VGKQTSSLNRRLELIALSERKITCFHSYMKSRLKNIIIIISRKHDDKRGTVGRKPMEGEGKVECDGRKYD
jgi:hypothetical protein